ncbi:DUF4249 domain-containing protein [Bacteroidales bacterium OttesenSCG-928-K03]|nr:DUF4249 domain-containing protein [Bacteroidales bacterium OttesenSCG-928-L14]MDL2240336.1 DUF4249 domain-containing protein [Bacteroidales bacterium OttesenSCG-928-K22]MDL2242489.1 DUF4249 domain-containing protein [Bacteroidales bacterium OttesenSCG-928-K03]
MKFSHFILIVISVFLLSSCVDYVNIKQTFDIEPQLVLYSRICPQADTNYAYVYNSNVFFSSKSGKEIEEQSNALVEISSDEKNWIAFSYTDSTSYFIEKDKFLIEEGDTYYIRASHNEYETVTSSCTVPYARDVDFKVSKEKVDCYNNHQHYVYSWTDFPNEENYYMMWRVYLNLWFDYYYDEDGNWHEDSSYFGSFRHIMDYHSLEIVFNDQEHDGGLIKVVDSDCDYEAPDGQIVHLGQDTVCFVIMDKSCYLYEKAIDNYNNSMGIDLISIFEPVLIYSNIENGLGLFGAFSIRKYSISELIVVP